MADVSPKGFTVGEKVVVMSQGRRLGTVRRIGVFDDDGAPAVIIGDVLHPERDIDHLTRKDTA
jgi:hypothetical protein